MLARNSLLAWLAAWAASPAEAWELKADMRTEVILQLQQAGIKSHLNYYHASTAGAGTAAVAGTEAAGS